MKKKHLNFSGPPDPPVNCTVGEPDPFKVNQNQNQKCKVKKKTLFPAEPIIPAQHPKFISLSSAIKDLVVSKQERPISDLILVCKLIITLCSFNSMEQHTIDGIFAAKWTWLLKLAIQVFFPHAHLDSDYEHDAHATEYFQN